MIERKGQGKHTDDHPEVILVLHRVSCPHVHVDSARRAAGCTTDVKAGVVERAEAEVIRAGELSGSRKEGGTCNRCPPGRLSARRVEVDQADRQAVEVLWLSEVGPPCKRQSGSTPHTHLSGRRARLTVDGQARPHEERRQRDSLQQRPG